MLKVMMKIEKVQIRPLRGGFLRDYSDDAQLYVTLEDGTVEYFSGIKYGQKSITSSELVGLTLAEANRLWLEVFGQ